MTTQNTATVAPPMTTAARRYSEQIHALVDRQTREYLIGLAGILAEEGGYDRPKEGEVIRTLLDEAIGKRYIRDTAGYEHVVRVGRAELERRAAEAEARKASRETAETAEGGAPVRA
jgi:hypothetical protein